MPRLGQRSWFVHPWVDASSRSRHGIESGGCPVTSTSRRRVPFAERSSRGVIDETRAMSAIGRLLALPVVVSRSQPLILGGVDHSSEHRHPRRDLCRTGAPSQRAIADCGSSSRRSAEPPCADPSSVRVRPVARIPNRQSGAEPLCPASRHARHWTMRRVRRRHRLRCCTHRHWPDRLA